MKFLVDVQLPPRLARKLTALGHEAQHVTELAPPTTPDWDIWSLARNGGYVVVSKDEDFADLTQRRGGEVAVVWLRCGNINNDELIALIERHLPTITESLSRGPRLVEVS